MDCALPGINGLQATRQILEAAPETLILMLSMHPEETLVQTGAGSRSTRLHSEKCGRPGIGHRDPKGRGGRNSTRPQLEPSGLRVNATTALTTRELEILQMIVDGKSNKEIAAELSSSANTVAVHRANMMDALGIHKTAELVVYAIRNGLVNIP